MGVYAKTGITFESGQGFVFTGNNSGSDWEIDYPTATGALIHGVTETYTDSTGSYPALIVGIGPLYIQISTNVSAFDELTIDTNAKFKNRGISDSLSGIAITSGTAGNSCIALIIPLSTPLNISSLAQGDMLIQGASGWQRLSPGTSGTVFTSNGAGMLPTYQSPVRGILQVGSGKVTADQTTTSSTLVDLPGASVTLTTQASSKLIICVSYSMSNTSALGSMNRIALVIDGTVESGVGSGFQTPLISNFAQGGSIHIVKTGLAAGSHTIKLQWSNTTGTTQCRPATGAPNTEHASIIVMESAV